MANTTIGSVVLLGVGLGAGVYVGNRHSASAKSASTVPEPVARVQVPAGGMPAHESARVSVDEPAAPPPKPRHPAVAAMERSFATPDDHAAAVIGALRDSGPAAQPLAGQGYAMGRLLLDEKLGTDDWACFSGGCYFHLTRDTTPDEIVAIRERSAPGHVVAITADPVPDKLVVLINEPQETHDQTPIPAPL